MSFIPTYESTYEGFQNSKAIDNFGEPNHSLRFGIDGHIDNREEMSDVRSRNLTRWLDQAGVHIGETAATETEDLMVTEDAIPDEDIYMGDRTVNVQAPGQMYFTGKGGDLTATDISFMRRPRTWCDPPVCLDIIEDGPPCQPAKANEAMEKFESVCANLAPVSRQASWGTKPISRVGSEEESDALTSGNFLKQLNLGSREATGNHGLDRPNILHSLRQFVPRVKGLLKRTPLGSEGCLEAAANHSAQGPCRPISSSFNSISSGSANSTQAPLTACSDATAITIPSPNAFMPPSFAGSHGENVKSYDVPTPLLEHRRGEPSDIARNMHSADADYPVGSPVKPLLMRHQTTHTETFPPSSPVVPMSHQAEGTDNSHHHKASDGGESNCDSPSETKSQDSQGSQGPCDGGDGYQQDQADGAASVTPQGQFGDASMLQPYPTARRRSSARDMEESGNDDGSDRRKRRRKRSGTDANDSGAILARLACPYQAFEPWQDCFRRGPRNPNGGCDGIYRLRQHFNRRHKLSHRCQRCWKAFENKADARQHEAEETCDPKPRSPNERFMHPEHEVEVDRSCGAMSEEEVWWEMFRILIPGMRDCDASWPKTQYSPYYLVLEGNTFMIPTLHFSDAVFQTPQSLHAMPLGSPTPLPAWYDSHYRTNTPPNDETLLLTHHHHHHASSSGSGSGVPNNNNNNNPLAAAPVSLPSTLLPVGGPAYGMDFLSQQPLPVAPLYQAHGPRCVPEPSPSSSAAPVAAAAAARLHYQQHRHRVSLDAVSHVSSSGDSPPMAWQPSPPGTGTVSSAAATPPTRTSALAGAEKATTGAGGGGGALAFATAPPTPASSSSTLLQPFQQQQQQQQQYQYQHQQYQQLQRNHERLRQRHAQTEADNAAMREANREARGELGMVEELLEVVLAAGGLPPSSFERLSQMSEVVMRVQGRLR